MKKRDYVGFAIGGIGHNLIYALFSGYLLVFYTDVFHLSGGFTAVLFLIARIFDAINDPIMGIIADKTNSRFGRYRVWLMRAAPIIAAALCLCFFVPDTSHTLQYIYCYITYILLGVSFTCADIPYWSLPPAITGDAERRSLLFGAGSIAGCLASGIGAIAVPVIVERSGNASKGYLTCAVLFSAIGVVCYYACAALTQERIAPKNTHETLKASLSCIVRNKPLLFLMGTSLLGNLAFQIKISFNTYYGQYALGKYGYVTYLSGMLLIGMLIGSFFAPMLIKKFGGKAAMLIVLAAGIVISAIYFIAGYKNLTAVLLFSALSATVIGAFSVLVNAMTADAVDYADYYIGERCEGVITSTRTFITKVATAIAGIAAGVALDAIHYIPNMNQTQAVKDSFHLFMSLCPAVLYLVGFLILCGYPLKKDRLTEIQLELHERRNNGTDIC